MFESKHPIAILLIMAIILGMIFWFAGGSRVKDLAPYYIKKVLGETAEVKIRNAVVKVEVAQTVKSRAKGLSGRDFLDVNQGMLFVFHEPAVYPFTMQDTNISLDIIWILDQDIVYIARNAQPGAKSINPQAEANYVLEVRAGLAGSNNWHLGDTVAITFDKDK